MYYESSVTVVLPIFSFEFDCQSPVDIIIITITSNSINPNPHGGGVFHPLLEVFLAVFLKDINYVPQTHLTFANSLFLTF